MAKVSELIDRACGPHGAKQSAAEHTLISRGASAASDLIEELRSGRRECGGYLGAILGRMTDPDVVPLLVAELDASGDLYFEVPRALAAIRDRRAVAPLCERLSVAGPGRATILAGALGEIGDTSARPPLDRQVQALIGGGGPEVVHELCHRAEEEHEFRRAKLLLEASTALAKLGDQRHAFVPLAVLEHAFSGDETEAYGLRSRAAHATQHLVAPGMYAILERALVDENVEVRRGVVRGLYYLGLRQSIAALVEIVGRDQDPEVGELVPRFLQELTGAGGDVEADDEREPWIEWWRAHEGRFPAGTCYFAGQPLSLGDLVDQLAGDKRAAASAHLRIATGQDFGYDRALPSTTPQREVVARARAWWAAHREAFPAGRLYKHGAAQDVLGL